MTEIPSHLREIRSHSRITILGKVHYLFKKQDGPGYICVSIDNVLTGNVPEEVFK